MVPYNLGLIKIRKPLLEQRRFLSQKVVFKTQTLIRESYW